MLRLSAILFSLLCLCSSCLVAQWSVPNIVSPSNNSSNVSLNPLVRWTSKAGTLYTVQLSQTEEFKSVLMSTSLIAASEYSEIILSGLSHNVRYFVRVRATVAKVTGDWSTTVNFTTTAPSHAFSLGIEPTEGSTQQPLQTELSWRKVAGVQHYDIEVSPTPQFSYIAFHAEDVTETHITTNPLSPSLVYYWHVRPHFDLGTAAWCKANKFSTGEAPMAPSLVYPEPEFVASVAKINFRWNAIPKTKSYHLQVAKNSTFQDLILDEDRISTTSIDKEVSVGPLVFWRVSAVNAIGESTWSPWRSIQTLNTAVPADMPLELLNLSIRPNPTSSIATFCYTVPAPGQVSISVYDAQGMEVAHSIQPCLQVGTYSSPIDLSDVPKGMYIYGIRYSGTSQHGKLSVTH